MTATEDCVFTGDVFCRRVPAVCFSPNTRAPVPNPFLPNLNTLRARRKTQQIVLPIPSHWQTLFPHFFWASPHHQTSISICFPFLSSELRNMIPVADCGKRRFTLLWNHGWRLLWISHFILSCASLYFLLFCVTANEGGFKYLRRTSHVIQKKDLKCHPSKKKTLHVIQKRTLHVIQKRTLHVIHPKKGPYMSSIQKKDLACIHPNKRTLNVIHPKKTLHVIHPKKPYMSSIQKRTVLLNCL